LPENTLNIILSRQIYLISNGSVFKNMTSKSVLIIVLKTLWLVLCAIIAFPYFTGGIYSGEHSMGFFLTMTMITLPAGYIVALMLNILGWLTYNLISGDIINPLLYSVVIWIIFTVSGYLQWFVLAPYFFKKIKMMR